MPGKRKVFAVNMRTRLIFRAAGAEGAEAAVQFVGCERVGKQCSSDPLLHHLASDIR